MRNTGNEPAEITAFELAEGDLWVELAPPLPWTLEPGASERLWVNYRPLDVRDLSAVLSAETDAPLQTTAPVGASVEPWDTVTDTWTQRADLRVDVVFTLDQTPSMAAHATDVNAQFPAFYEALLARGLDARIAALAPADGCIRGGSWIDTTMDAAQARDVWNTMTCAAQEFGCDDAGLAGERAFTLLDLALAGTAAGGCNEGLLRSGTDLVIVGVADEPEQSLLDWSDYVADIETYVDAPGTLTVHGIGGPYPTGCEGVMAYSGFYEASVATGGHLWSLCDPLDATFDALAESLPSMRSQFDLSESPMASTLEVWVDGTQVFLGWSYSADDNAVVFDEAPAPGAGIEVRYALPGCVQ